MATGGEEVIDDKQMEISSSSSTKYKSDSEIQFQKLQKADWKINSEKKKKEEIAMMMQPYANWDQLLVSVPMCIELLGQLMLIATNTDFTLVDSSSQSCFKHLKYPHSFSASLVQLSNIGWTSFNQAHVSMDEIRLHTSNVDTHVEYLVKFLTEGNTDSVPYILGNIRDTADACVELSANAEQHFLNFMEVAAELLEASTKAKGVYESKSKETEAAIEIAKSEVDIAKGEKEQSEKELKRTEEELEMAMKGFVEALGKEPSTSKLLGLNIVDTFIGVLRPITTFDLTALHVHVHGKTTKKPSKEDKENERSMRKMYRFADKIQIEIGNLTSALLPSSEESGNKTLDFGKIRSVTPSRIALQTVIENMKLACEVPSEEYNFALSLCEEGVTLFEQIEGISKCIQEYDPEKIEKLRKEADALKIKSHNFTKRAHSFLNIPSTQQPGPCAKEKHIRFTNSGLVQAELEKYQFKVEEQIHLLENARNKQENILKDIKESNEILQRNIQKIAQKNIQEIDFNEIRDTIIMGIHEIQKIRLQWGRLVKFFQMMSRIVRIKFQATVRHFVKFVNSGDKQIVDRNEIQSVTNEVIYDTAFRASVIAYIVNSISGMYVDVSNKYLMTQMTSLGDLLALDPKKDEDKDKIQCKRRDLAEASKEAQTFIAELAEANGAKCTKKLEQKMQQVQLEIEPLLPTKLSISYKEEREIDEFV